MSLVKTAIGLMSGTSMDGIDAALMRTDGLNYIENIAGFTLPYSDEFREELKKAFHDAEKATGHYDRPGQLRDIEIALTDRHFEAVHLLLQKVGMNATDIDLIGFHGQTVLHRPEQALTIQLGDGERLAEQTKINVVYDMRANDMLHGGQGAPLVPVYHQALLHKHQSEVAFPVAFINIGGISNLTYIDDKNTLIAFDCGPGNALIDQWIKQKTGANFDDGGQMGLKGAVNQTVVDAYKNHSFFSQPKPGSLDWRDFSLPELNLTTKDGAATFAFLTAYSIIHSLRHVPHMPKMLIISGGGAKNLAITHYLAELSEKFGAQAIDCAAIGLHTDFIEAEAWAYLAVRSFNNLPLTFPSTTGCKKPVTGGKLIKAAELTGNHPNYIDNFIQAGEESHKMAASSRREN